MHPVSATSFTPTHYDTCLLLALSLCLFNTLRRSAQLGVHDLLLKSEKTWDKMVEPNPGLQDLWLNDNQLSNQEALLERLREVAGTLTTLYVANNPASAGQFALRVRAGLLHKPPPIACCKHGWNATQDGTLL